MAVTEETEYNRLWAQQSQQNPGDPLHRHQVPPGETVRPAYMYPTLLPCIQVHIYVRRSRRHFTVRRVCVCVCVCEKVTQLRLTLCPMDCSPPGCSVHGVLQARILEWVAISFSSKIEYPNVYVGLHCGRHHTSLSLLHWNNTGV